MWKALMHSFSCSRHCICIEAGVALHHARRAFDERGRGAVEDDVPTVLRLIEHGELTGWKQPRGTKFRWHISRASVTASIKKNGTFPRKNDGRASRLTRVEVEIAALRAQVADLATGHDPADGRLHRERDDLRATVVALQDALVRTRSAAELRARAEEERAVMVGHLREAVAAGERADELRRAAVRELEEVAAAVVSQAQDMRGARGVARRAPRSQPRGTWWMRRWPRSEGCGPPRRRRLPSAAVQAPVSLPVRSRCRSPR